MKKLFLNAALFCTTFFSITSQARFQMGTELEVTTGVPAWNRSFANSLQDPQEKLTECRAVREIAGAYLCLFHHQLDMNQALGRISIYAEGTGEYKPGSLLTHEEAEATGILRVGGHDIPNAQVEAFFDAALKACVRRANYCLSPAEQELYDAFFSPLINRGADFVIITYALQNNLSWEAVVTHEILHAQYFLQNAFRKTVDDYWYNRVKAEDKPSIIKALQRVGYNVSPVPGEDLLLINEFQAYILMAGAERMHLRSFVPTYRDELFHLLEKQGVAPIQVQSEQN